MSYRPNVLALDLSITSTGIAFPDGTTDTLKTNPRDGDLRLNEIVDDIMLAAYHADLVVIEGPVTRSQAATVIGMVQGAVRYALNRGGQAYVIAPPASVKKYATGKGNAAKPDMRVALVQRAGFDNGHEDEVDAWWLRAAALDAYGHPVVEMPKANRAALAGVPWPDLHVDGDVVPPAGVIEP